MMKRQLINRDLPDDIVRHILTRLPFTSILTLKCVSKQWKRVIDSVFETKTATFPSTHHFHCLHIMTYSFSTDRYLSCNPSQPPLVVRRVPFTPQVSTNQYLKVKRVCDGMACYYRFGYGGGQFLFRNLSTGASYAPKRSPLLEFAGDDDDASWPWLCYGIGYDASDEDYKMMAVCKYNLGDIDAAGGQTEDYSVFWVYSFKSEKWARREGFPRASYQWEKSLPMACAFDGKLHWIVSGRKRNHRRRVILTFDLHTCGFGEIEQHGLYICAFPMGNLMVLGGRLCYWCLCPYKPIKMWVMNNYSWKRLWAVDYLNTGHHDIFKQRVEPVALHEVRDGNKLVFFLRPSTGSLFWVQYRQEEVVL